MIYFSNTILTENVLLCYRYTGVHMIFEMLRLKKHFDCTKIFLIYNYNTNFLLQKKYHTISLCLDSIIFSRRILGSVCRRVISSAETINEQMNNGTKS